MNYETLTELRGRCTASRDALHDLNVKRAKEGLTSDEQSRYALLIEEVRDFDRELKATQALYDTRNVMGGNVLDEDGAFLEHALRAKKDRRVVEFNLNLREDVLVTASGTSPSAPSGGSSSAKHVMMTDVASVTPLLYKDLLEPLSKNSLTAKVGMPWETNVQGTPTWATYTQFEAQMLGEAVALSDTKFDFKTIRATPHRVGVTTSLTNSSINQSKYDLRAIVMKQQRDAIDRLLNKWFFGTEAPTGVLATATPSPFVAAAKKPLTYDSVISWEDLAKLELAVASKDIPMDGSGGCYLMNPEQFYQLKYTPIVGGTYPSMLASPGPGFGERLLNGAKCLASNHIPKGVVLYGVFDNAYVSQFGTVRMVVDPITGATTDTVRFTVNTEFDITTLYKDAFAVLKKKTS